MLRFCFSTCASAWYRHQTKQPTIPHTEDIHRLCPSIFNLIVGQVDVGDAPVEQQRCRDRLTLRTFWLLKSLLTKAFESS